MFNKIGLLLFVFGVFGVMGCGGSTTNEYNYYGTEGGAAGNSSIYSIVRIINAGGNTGDAGSGGNTVNGNNSGVPTDTSSVSIGGTGGTYTVTNGGTSAGGSTSAGSDGTAGKGTQMAGLDISYGTFSTNGTFSTKTIQVQEALAEVTGATYVYFDVYAPWSGAAEGKYGNNTEDCTGLKSIVVTFEVNSSKGTASELKYQVALLSSTGDGSGANVILTPGVEIEATGEVSTFVGGYDITHVQSVGIRIIKGVADEVITLKVKSIVLNY
jgi:hypothetical protein